jgi:site-specific DNA-methyltransferase (adenine-specific)
MNTDTIIAGNCIDILPTLAARCANLVFVDPPFNIGLPYTGYADRLTRQNYLAFTDQWLAAVTRVLSPGGSLFVQISDEWAGYLQVRLDALGLTWRNTIIWHYEFGPHLSRKFGRNHQQILYYVACPDLFTFNADAVRIPSKRQTQYRDKRAASGGRVPGDVWSIRRVHGRCKIRRQHPCQTAPEVAERIIAAASKPGDLILDPMCGSGTVLAAAKRLQRRYIGIELSEATADKARSYVAEGSPYLFV